MKDKAKTRVKACTMIAAQVKRPSFDEILAPFRKGFRESGSTEDELLDFFEEIREKIYQEKIVTG